MTLAALAGAAFFVLIGATFVLQAALWLAAALLRAAGLLVCVLIYLLCRTFSAVSMRDAGVAFSRPWS
jgi:hypothetical protein